MITVLRRWFRIAPILNIAATDGVIARARQSPAFTSLSSRQVGESAHHYIVDIREQGGRLGERSGKAVNRLSWTEMKSDLLNSMQVPDALSQSSRVLL